MDEESISIQNWILISASESNAITEIFISHPIDCTNDFLLPPREILEKNVNINDVGLFTGQLNKQVIFPNFFLIPCSSLF